MNNIPLDDHTHAVAPLSTNATEHQKGDVRFWQGVALSLAIFALSLLASLVLGVGVMLLSR